MVLIISPTFAVQDQLPDKDDEPVYYTYLCCWRSDRQIHGRTHDQVFSL